MCNVCGVISTPLSLINHKLKNLNLAVGVSASFFCSFLRFPTKSGDQAAELDFVVVEKSPFDLTIVLLTLASI